MKISDLLLVLENDDTKLKRFSILDSIQTILKWTKFDSEN